MENRIDRLLSYPGRMEAETYAYTAGLLAEKFLMDLKNEGKIKAAYCHRCEKLFLPVRAFCIFCGGEVRDLKEIEQEGYIESYTEVKLNSYEEKLEKPIIVAFIRFKNVTGGLIHKIKGSIEEIKIGTKVKPILKEKRERKGSLDDIEYFEVIH